MPLEENRGCCAFGASMAHLLRVMHADTICPMQWLMHGSVTPAVAEALKKRGDTPHSIVEAGLPADAAVSEVLLVAKEKQYDIITTDPALSAAVFETKLWFQRSIVYLQLQGGDIEQDEAIDRLFARYKRLTPGRLFTVTGSRVKIRQLPHRL